MEGANAVLFDFVVFNITGTSPTCRVALQGSNDLQNWDAIREPIQDMDIAEDATSEGYWANNTFSGGDVLAKDVEYEYVRLKYVMTSGTAAVISSGIHAFEI